MNSKKIKRKHIKFRFKKQRTYQQQYREEKLNIMDKIGMRYTLNLSILYHLFDMHDNAILGTIERLLTTRFLLLLPYPF